MNNIDKLLKQLLEQKKDHVSSEALRLANELIKEFNITCDQDLAHTLEIEVDVNDRKAVRIWAQQNLHRVDPDETEFERYRQLRHLFQKQLPDFYQGI